MRKDIRTMGWKASLPGEGKWHNNHKWHCSIAFD